jgi:hypothetical protein
VPAPSGRPSMPRVFFQALPKYQASNACPSFPHTPTQVGGTPALLKYLLERNYIDGSCLTVTGRSMADNLAGCKPLAEGQQVGCALYGWVLGGSAKQSIPDRCMLGAASRCQAPGKGVSGWGMGKTRRVLSHCLSLFFICFCHLEAAVEHPCKHPCPLPPIPSLRSSYHWRPPSKRLATSLSCMATSHPRDLWARSRARKACYSRGTRCALTARRTCLRRSPRTKSLSGWVGGGQHVHASRVCMYTHV